MKRVLGLFIALALVIIPTTIVKAEDNYFYAGDNVLVSEEYNHSVFGAGESVKSSGTVNGINFGAGNNVSISGKSSYGFFAGQNVSIDGEIENDLFAAGGNIVVLKDAILNRDVYLAANSVEIKTDIKGNAFIAASIVNLDDIYVDGNLRIYANQININGNVNIKGTLYVNEGIVINNENNLTTGKKEIDKVTKLEFKTRVNDTILSILTMIFSAMVLSLIFPKLFKKLDYELSVKDVFKKMFIGLAFLVVVPLLSIILFVISVGVSLGAILFFLYLIAIMISSILSAYVIGDNLYTKVFKQKENMYVSLVIGILVIKIVELIPVLGAFASLAVFTYGLGLIYKYVHNESK